uniref:Fibroblast growth factor receptor-like 1 n=1 Tax=Fundulus heteroclitus TaxID=8078 RepID=A0A3Q2P7W2_FUNHE
MGPCVRVGRGHVYLPSPLFLLLPGRPFVLRHRRGPPRVSDKVTHRQTARLGSAIKLPCPVEADPPPLIRWTKDGRNIHRGWIRFRVLRMGLKIKEVEADDAGTFNCQATNGFGSVNVNYTLIIIASIKEAMRMPARPRFTQPEKMRRRVIACPVGSTVRLKCAAGGSPRPDIVWLKDDRPLTEREVGEGRQRKWTLSLKNVVPEHSGRYTCRVSNRAGEINATYKVEVIQRTSSKPVLTGTHPVNTTVDYGGTTSLQCKVRSDVKPVIQWLKRIESNEEGRYNSTIEVGDHKFVVLPLGEVWSRPDGSYLNKLLISRAKEDDAGMYVCLGANTMGYSFRSAFLTVLPGTKPPVSPLATSTSSLPWPVIIGIPAGIVFIFATVLLWFCQSRKHCPPPSSPAQQPLQSSHRSQSYRERDRACPAPSSSSSGADKDCLSSTNYEEYLAQQQQLLLSQAGPSVPPKIYPKLYTDIHTHTHSHVDGKVHQHQHIHFQC